jgi:hypothetical protein
MWNWTKHVMGLDELSSVNESFFDHVMSQLDESIVKNEYTPKNKNSFEKNGYSLPKKWDSFYCWRWANRMCGLVPGRFIFKVFFSRILSKYCQFYKFVCCSIKCQGIPNMQFFGLHTMMWSLKFHIFKE